MSVSIYCTDTRETLRVDSAILFRGFGDMQLTNIIPEFITLDRMFAAQFIIYTLTNQSVINLEINIEDVKYIDQLCKKYFILTNLKDIIHQYYIESGYYMTLLKEDITDVDFFYDNFNSEKYILFNIIDNYICANASEFSDSITETRYYADAVIEKKIMFLFAIKKITLANRYIINCKHMHVMDNTNLLPMPYYFNIMFYRKYQNQLKYDLSNYPIFLRLPPEPNKISSPFLYLRAIFPLEILLYDPFALCTRESDSYVLYLNSDKKIPNVLTRYKRFTSNGRISIQHIEHKISTYKSYEIGTNKYTVSFFRNQKNNFIPPQTTLFNITTLNI